MNDLARRSWTGLARLDSALLLCLLVSAGTHRFWQAWVWVAIFTTGVMAITVYLLRHDAALLERRLTAGPAAEQRPTQKVVQTIASLAFISLFVIPGLDHRFGWSAVPPAVVASGNALVAVGLWVVFMTFRENSYTSALIETAADQTVVTTGPYRVVRHPMYSGALVMMAGTALALASYWALASVGVLLAALVARLVDEERFLSATLPGYRAYVARTRARLVPFVW